MNYKKKILYSICTSPFLCKIFSHCLKFFNLDLTISAHRWQKRRKIEKTHEIGLREKRLNAEPIKLDFEKINFPNEDDLFREEWEFRPIELEGYFDNKMIFITKTKEAEPGYQVISPFVCYKDNEGRNCAILIDRGWIPYDWKENKDNMEKMQNENKKSRKIHGVLYRGDRKNKFSSGEEEDNKNLIQKENISGKWINEQPSELASYFKLANKELASKFIIKQVDFMKNENNNFVNSQYSRNMYPKLCNLNDLMFWTITPQKHQEYANFWFCASFFNVISNIFVWLL